MANARMSSAVSSGCGAGQQQHHRGVPQDGVGQLGDGLLTDPVGESRREDHPQRLGHPLDRRAVVPVGQFEHRAAGSSVIIRFEHAVAAELQDRQRERLDVVIRLRPSLFQFGGDVGEQHDVLALDDGRDQFVLVARTAGRWWCG